MAGPDITSQTISNPPGVGVDIAELLRPRRKGARMRTSVGIFISVVAHVSAFGGAWLYARLLPPHTIPERPIMAKLVQLGKPREKFLPRNSAAAAPPPSHPHVAKPLVDPKVAVPRPSDTGVALDKKPADVPEKESRAEEAEALQKKMEEAMSKLETKETGPSKTVNEREGKLDGVAEGDSDVAAEGDKYAMQVKDALKRNFEVPTTISQQERLYLSCDLLMYISSTGKIVNFKIDKSSGNSQYDRAVEATLQRTTLPPPPEKLAKSYATDGLAVRFKP